MVEVMIKICSLNFLKEDSFKTDVKTADGAVLCQLGDPITPEVILKLYFKEIYVDKKYLQESQAEEEPEMMSKNIDASVAFMHVAEEVSSGPKSVDISLEANEVPSGPRTVDVDVDLDVNLPAEEVGKGPRFAEVATGATKGKNPTAASSKKHTIEEAEVAVLVEDPENMPLEFDESQAKRIVEHSIKLGKLANFSASELKELEQAAYYCNIGITNFKKADAIKKGFRKKRLFAGYQKLLEDGTVPANIAEIIKFCANCYESESFPLDSKIPPQHIIAITSFYEEMLAKNNSKQETLLKMLQMGGNQFNIFILHKFIKLMRGDNG